MLHLSVNDVSNKQQVQEKEQQKGKSWKEKFGTRFLWNSKKNSQKDS